MSKINERCTNKYVIYIPETGEGFVSTTIGVTYDAWKWNFFFEKKNAECLLKQWVNELNKKIKKTKKEIEHLNKKEKKYGINYDVSNTKLLILEDELRVAETAVVKKVKITLTEVEDGE